MKPRFRLVTVLAAVAGLGLLAGCDRYVALGDSFTSGPAIQPQEISTPGCLRSLANYPHLIAPDLQGHSLTDVSCSGAQTIDMTTSQDVTPNPDPAPQFDALGPQTKLVTLGIGGNDIGFVDIAVTCGRLALLSPLATSPCRDYYTANGIVDDRIAALGPRLNAVLKGIEARAPAAKIFVVGYPAILPEDPSQYVLCRPVLPVATGDIPYLRDEVHKALNRKIKGRATAHGAVYVDTYTPSIGHDACQLPTVRWVEPVAPAADAAPVHPNRLGMEATARAVEAAMRAHGVAVG
jgi:hypothetical protein